MAYPVPSALAGPDIGRCAILNDLHNLPGPPDLSGFATPITAGFAPRVSIEGMHFPQASLNSTADAFPGHPHAIGRPR